MIKKITEKEIDGRNVKYAMMILFGSIFFILSIVNMMGLFSFEGSEILWVGIYGLPIAIWGIVLISELEEQIEHPERFVYCKKCGKIIKKKHIFCFSCRQDIKREIERADSINHIKDYTKFYKGKKK